MKQQTVGYKIRFITGELAGRTFAIPNSGTTIGRRRDADIRPGGTDIAAEHLSLMPQADSGVLMHVYDNESAWVDGNEIAGGADALLTPGEDVRIGKELTFVLERNDSAMNESPALSEEEAEEATEELTEDASGQPAQPDGDCTRYASAAELEDLRKFSRAQKRRKKPLQRKEEQHYEKR